MDNVHVAIRVRPLIKREDDENSQIFWQADKNSICQTANKSAKPYIFDRVFAHNESTDVVYKEIAQPIVQASMNGYDGTIFAYGQTSSGKTHTMQGDANELGIIPRAVDELFDIIDKTPEREFLFRVSYMEIYNEIINDLLNEEKQQLIIRENKQRRVYVSNLHEAFVSDADEVLDLMRKGNEHRHIGQTNMNEHSSRSHTIFKVIIESRERRDDETLDLAVNCSELNLIDLAGSERANDTKAHGQRLKEAGNINRSLFSLCNVISKLSAGAEFIPFRDSKLTRILQSALGGNAKTAVVCTVTPASLDQTESTLQFASRAKTITNKPEINEILTGEAQIQRCQKEITSLKAQLEFYQQGQQVQPTVQEQERIAKLEEEKLLQQRKIQQLESMILVSKPKGQEVSISEKRKQRRLTWCPGALKRRMMNTSLTDDFLPKRNVFQRLSDGSAEEVQSLPSSSPVGLNTLNDSKEGVSFSDEAFNNVQSSPVLKRQKGVRWADHTHVATQTSNLEELNDKEEQFQEMFTICEGLMSEKEKMEEQMKTTNVELLNLNQIISELESDKTEMSQEKENLKRVIEEAEELKLFEADEKNMWKKEEAELLARVSAMESEVASMRGEVEAAEQSKAEMEILHNMEKEKQERRVKELTSQLQLSYDEQNNQSDSASEWSENENKLKELMAETVLLREKEERTLEELSQLTNSKRELEDVIEKSKISFAELEEKFTASQTELEAVKALAEEQRRAEEKLRSSEAEKVGELEAKIENLKKDLESHVEEKVKIQAEFAEERIAKEKLEQEIATSKTQMESMELNVQKLQGDADTWKKALESQRTEMEEKLTELMAEIQAQKDEDRNREEEMEKLRGELAGYREEALNLKTEASDLDEARSELGRMEAELSSTRAELESLRDCKASNQEEETEVKMRELTELLEAERVTGQERSERLQSEIDRLQGLVEEMEIASTASKQSWEEIDEELKASKAQMEEQRDIYERREEELEAQLAGMEKAVEVRQDSESGAMESHKLLEEVERYREEIDRLQGQITLLEADSARTLESSSRCEQLELELRNVREELVRGKQDEEDVTAEVSKNEDAERLRGETERYQAELEQLREEIVTLRKTNDDLAEAKSKLARVEEELEDAKMKEEESRCELEVLQEEVALFKDLNNDLTDAEAKLTIKEQELESARSEIDQYLVEVEKLKDELNQVKALTGGLSNGEEDRKRENEIVSEQENVLEDEVIRLRNESEELTVTKMKLQEELQTAHANLTSLQEASEIQKQEFEDCLEELKGIVQEKGNDDRADEEMESLTKAAADYQEQVKELEHQKKELEDVKMRGEEQITTLEEKLMKMESELKTTEEKLEEAANERETIKATLEGSIDELRLDLESKILELELAKEECDSLRSAGNVHGEMENAMDQLEKQIKELTAERKQLKEDLEESISCSIDAQEELVKTQEALEEAKQKLTTLEENFEQQMANKEQNQKTSEDEFDFFTDTIASLQREKESLEQETKERQDLISHYEEKSSKLEKEAAMLNDQLQEKIQEVELYEATGKELQEKLDKSEKEYEQLNKEYDEMIRLQEEAETASAKLMEELEDQKQQLQNATAEIEELQRQAKQQEETSRENELQEKLDQAVQYLEQINKEYETERERHLETLKEKEELEQTLKTGKETVLSKMNLLMEDCNSANVKYEEALKERETTENLLREEKEKNEKLQAELEDERASLREMQLETRQDDKNDTNELQTLTQSLDEEKKLHSQSKKLNEELQQKLKSYEEEAIAKMKALMTSCQTANKKYQKAIKEQEKAETLLTEERNKNEKLMTEMQNENRVDGVQVKSLQEEKQELSDRNIKLEEKLKCFEEQALSKVKRLMDISKTANKKYKVAVREQEIAGKLLKEEKLKNESLLAKLEDERASSKLMKSTTRPEEKDDSAALKRLNQSLIEEKRLHSETKRINKELQSKLTTLEKSRVPSSQGSICSETMEGSASFDTVTDIPDPKTLKKEDLVTLVDELGAERKSHKRQLQQYNEMMNDMSGPSVNSCGSGVIASVAVLHLKSHNYHLEKENIVVEKKLKKVSELYKTERSKYEEMKEKKEYWKGEYSKFIHGKRKLDAPPTTSKPLKDNNSPAVHQSPAKRVRNANVSEKPVRKDQPSLESAAWLDAEIENLQDQENCTTQ
ncbi:uncharacterized protein [Apostichopus japonicus]